MRYAHLFAVSGFFFSLLLASPAHAQSTDTRLWLTWRAVTYVPSASAVRALPIAATKIIAALDIIQNGRPVNLAGQTIYWYVNDEPLTGGLGMTRVSIPVPNTADDETFSVRATLPDYKGGLAKTVTIPVTAPTAVIETGAPGGIVRASPFIVRAFPYFFDIASPEELGVSWKINDVVPRTYSDPFTLNISLDKNFSSGSAIPLVLRLTNPAKVLEFATAQTSLIFRP
jgi:hypothetical protein